MNEPQNGRSILVVDDYPPSAELVGALLRDQGFAVELVSSGEDALIRLAEERFDAVIGDLDMPWMNGFELLRQIRARHPRLPAILMTAFIHDEMWRTAQAWGATGLLRKPCNGPELANAITSAFRGIFTRPRDASEQNANRRQAGAGRS